MSWNPEQYLKFSAPRFRPAQDLLARVHCEAPRNIHDLGCGPGNVTQLLLERWPEARIVGVDDSARMLAEAKRTEPRISWQQRDIATWMPEQPSNLIFSNAALHWLPHHEELFPRLMKALAPSGTLAVQMPRNFSAPSHTLVADTVREGAWFARLEKLLKPSPVAEPSFYYDLLAPHASSIDIWEIEYLQVLDGDNPVKEWTKGTWLKQFLEALQEPERQTFEDDYAQRVLRAYPVRNDGTTLFPFKRLFMVAKKRS